MSGMPVFEQKRDQMIEHLQKALALADEINDSATGYLIERAMDEARAAMVPSAAGANRQ
jgi:DNA-binding ferritin-like protein